MDNRIANDMISSGMIPSGKKNKEDLSRTQYGSAPSPSKLMDAYKSMYEHHQKDKDGNTIPHEGEELNEGKIPAGLQAYLDKKKGKKEDKKDMKEDVDLFDVISDKLIEEGYSKEESYKIMSNLTKEQLEEINEALVSGTLATLGLIGTKLLGGAKVAAAASKTLSAGKTLVGKGLGALKTAKTAVVSKAQAGMSKASDALSKVSNIAKPKGNKQLSLDLGKAGESKPTNTIGDKMSDLGKFVGDEVKGEVKRKIVQGDSGNKVTPMKTGTMSAGSYQAASADLFDIVKGQLLDEGMSEEEIKDIMLTLTPDEILNEISADLLKSAAKGAESARQRAAASGDTELAKKKLAQSQKFSDAMKSKNLEKSRAENMRKPTQYDRPLSRPTPDPTKPYPGTPR